MKKLLIILLTLLTVFTTVNNPVFGKNKNQEIKIESKKVDYQLPYPGILPDNLLYPVKQFRDFFWIFFTRDNLKKADIYHLVADKKVNAVIMLADKGKWGQAVETYTAAENDFNAAVKYYTLAKQQGSSASQETVLKLKLSNQKHKEIAETLLKNVPENNVNAVRSALKLNKKITSLLDKL